VNGLEKENLELLDEQVEQKNMRNQLVDDIQNLQREVEAREMEKQKYKEVFMVHL